MTPFNQAFIVGSGIGALSAAVLLIRDAGMRGSHIRILEESPLPGGALDGAGNPTHGYVTRGGRMFTDETYTCLWNVLESIPSAGNPARSVRVEVRGFNAQLRSDARVRELVLRLLTADQLADSPELRNLAGRCLSPR